MSCNKLEIRRIHGYFNKRRSGALLAFIFTGHLKKYRQRKEEEIEQEKRLRRGEKKRYNEHIRQLEGQVRSMKSDSPSRKRSDYDDLYERIKLNAGKENFHLKDPEWELLSNAIDEQYDSFTIRLLALNSTLSEHEMHVCYLVKLGLSSVAIGKMLYKSDKAIFMTRQRLYAKLMGKEGTARQLNDFIKSF